MTYLPNLFKRVDDFYRQATAFTKNAEQDYFQELTDISHNVGDPGLTRQLQMLAELYRYALSMGGGYATIAHAINNLKEMYGDDTDSDIENILNGMLKVLAKEAGGVQVLAGRDNPRFVERLMQLKSDIESRPSDSDTYESFQEEAYVPGAEGEGESDYSEQGLGGDTETVAPAQLGFGNKEDPKANRGWHTTGPSKLHRNWKEYYENEVSAYNLQIAQTSDPDTKTSLEELVKLIPQLSDLVERRTELSDKLKVVPDDKEVQTQLAVVQTKLKSIKEKVSALKGAVRSHQLKSQEDSLKSLLGEATKKSDTKQIALLEQKLALNALTQSTDVRKTKERNLRLRLIESMSGGNFPGKDTLEKEKSKIELAKKERVTKEAYDRELTEERGKQQGRLVTPDYEPTRGGRRVPMESLPQESKVDFDKAAFAALIKKLRDDNNTAIADARKYIMRPHEKGDPTFKPLVDSISAAIRKGDKVTQYATISELKQQIANKLKESSVNGYIQSIRLAPHFKNIEERLYSLVKVGKGVPEKMDSAGNLIIANFTEEDLQGISLLLNDINRLRNLYARYYQNAGGLKVQAQPYAFFKSVILALNKIELHLVTQLHARRPEKKILGPRTEYKSLRDIEEKNKLSHSERMTLLSMADKLEEKSKKQKDRELAEQRGKEQARESIPTYAPQRGGARIPRQNLSYEQQPDLELASFKGLIHQFQEDLNTCFSEQKKFITNAKQNGNPQLKPFIDKLAKAITKNDSQAKYEAIKLLKQATEQYLEHKLKRVIRIARLIPHFRKLRDDLNLLSKLQDPVNNSWMLNENNKTFVGNLIEKTARLQKISQSYYSSDNYALSSTLHDLARIKEYLEYVHTQGVSS